MMRWWCSCAASQGAFRSTVRSQARRMVTSLDGEWHPHHVPLEVFLRRLQCVSFGGDSARGLERFFRLTENTLSSPSSTLRAAVATRIVEESRALLCSDDVVGPMDVTRASLLAASALRLKQLQQAVPHPTAAESDPPPVDDVQTAIDQSCRAFLVVVQCVPKGATPAAVSGVASHVLRRTKKHHFLSRVRLPTLRANAPSPEMESELHMAWSRVLEAAVPQQGHTKPPLSESFGSLTPIPVTIVAEMIPVLEQSQVWTTHLKHADDDDAVGGRHGRRMLQSLAVMMVSFLSQCLLCVLHTPSDAGGGAGVDCTSLMDHVARMHEASSRVIDVGALHAEDLVALARMLSPLVRIARLQHGVASAAPVGESLDSRWSRNNKASRVSSLLTDVVAALASPAMLVLAEAAPGATLLIALRAAALTSPTVTTVPSIVSTPVLGRIVAAVEATVRRLTPADVVTSVSWLMSVLQIAVKDLEGATVLARHAAAALVKHPHSVLEHEHQCHHGHHFRGGAVMPLFSLLGQHTSSQLLSPMTPLHDVVADWIAAVPDVCDTEGGQLALYLKICVGAPAVYRFPIQHVLWQDVVPFLCRCTTSTDPSAILQSHLMWAVVALLSAGAEQPHVVSIDAALENVFGGAAARPVAERWCRDGDAEWRVALNFALRQFVRSQRRGDRSRLSRQAMQQLQQLSSSSAAHSAGLSHSTKA